MADSCLGGKQLTSTLQDDSAQYASLREREPLPDRFEHGVLLGQEARQRLVQVFQAYGPAPGRTDVVPRLVSEPLHVVREVAGELDDRVPQSGLRLDAAATEPQVEPVGEDARGNLLQPHHRARL